MIFSSRFLRIAGLAAFLAVNSSAVFSQTLDEATALSERVDALDAVGKFREAIPLARRALAIREQLLGFNHPNTAASLHDLASLFQAAGEYGEAEPLYARALAICEDVLGPDHANTIAVLSNFAELYRLSGDNAKAGSFYAQAGERAERTFGPDHPSTAKILNGLGLVYNEKGEFVEAERLFTRALAVIEKHLGGDHPTTGAAINNLAVLYENTGEYAKAESLYSRAVAIFEKAPGGQSHPRTAQALHNLATVYDDMGNYARAEPLFARALAVAEETFGAKHPITAQILGGRAKTYLATGAYDAARPLLTRALDIMEETLGRDHPDTAASMNNLASLYRETGDYSQSRRLFERSLAILEKTYGPDHPIIAAALNNLASVYAGPGAHARAEPLLRRALAITEKATPDHPDLATRLSNLAGLYRASGAHADASASLTRALRVADATLGEDHPNTAVILQNLAAEEWALQHWSSAAEIIARAERVDEANLAATLVLGDESRKRAYMERLDGGTDATITFSLAARERVADSETLGMQIVLRRKGRVLDVMADTLASIRQSLAPADQTMFERWRGTTEQYATLLFRGPERMPAAAYRALLTRLRDDAAALESHLSQRSTAFRAQVESVDIARVQRLIPEKAALVEWFLYTPFNPAPTAQQRSWGPPRYVAFVLRRNGKPAAIDVGAAQPIDVAVSNLRGALADPRNIVVHQLARELYVQLIAPLRTLIGMSEQILISPDGSLNLLPFGVLIDEQGRYLAEMIELTYLTSGRDLLRMDSSPLSRQPALIVADPDFGLIEAPGSSDSSKGNRRSVEMRGGLSFTRLSGTAQEAAAIRRILELGAEQVLVQGAAREGVLKQRRAPGILHLATHGFFFTDQQIQPVELRLDREQPTAPPSGEHPLLRSGLALAGANQLRSGDDDGILTALEVSGLDLAGTQLVVLSACETGVGQVKSGEGVYGLRRAFVQAGAHTQVASLWKVDDTATRDLMVDYYRRLSSGEGRSAALRSAQRAMLRNPKWRHPNYWAAFVVIGDPRPLRP
jgi:CHAT domain-containing protein/tetratricopeptide (TPR) repeat protein